jgi:hypothetical protein
MNLDRAHLSDGENQLMPTFFVIGAAKCGTTSLHQYLDLHPEISMSSFKEPAFFSPDRLYRLQVTDRDEYLRLFEPGSRQRGESSVSYSWWPIRKGPPEAISREVPGAKFVYLVRDPIERARSQHVQLESSRNPYSLRYFRGKALDRVWTDLDPRWNALVAGGLYMTQIRQYLEFFPKESILVVDSDDLRDDRVATLNRICSFLDVGPMPEQGEVFGEELNLAGNKRQEAEWYVRLTESPGLRRVIDPLPRGFRERFTGAMQRAVSHPIEKPALSDETREALEQVFRPEVEELREFTGQSFSGWSI